MSIYKTLKIYKNYNINGGGKIIKFNEDSFKNNKYNYFKNIKNVINQNDEYNMLVSNLVIEDFNIEIIGVIGSGSYGEVSLCIIDKSNELYAIKFFTNNDNQDINKKKCINEISFLIATSKLNISPRVINLFKHYENTSFNYCYVMNYLDGESGNSYLNNNFSMQNYNNIKLFYVEMKNCIDKMHSLKIKHSDLHMHNFYVISDENINLNIIDYGLALNYNINSISLSFSNLHNDDIYSYVNNNTYRFNKFYKLCDLLYASLRFYAIIADYYKDKYYINKESGKNHKYSISDLNNDELDILKLLTKNINIEFNKCFNNNNNNLHIFITEGCIFEICFSYDIANMSVELCFLYFYIIFSKNNIENLKKFTSIIFRNNKDNFNNLIKNININFVNKNYKINQLIIYIFNMIEPNKQRLLYDLKNYINQYIDSSYSKNYQFYIPIIYDYLINT